MLPELFADDCLPVSSIDCCFWKKAVKCLHKGTVTRHGAERWGGRESTTSSKLLSEKSWGNKSSHKVKFRDPGVKKAQKKPHLRAK